MLPPHLSAGRVTIVTEMCLDLAHNTQSKYSNCIDFTEFPIVKFPNQNNLLGIQTPVLLYSLGDILFISNRGGES